MQMPWTDASADAELVSAVRGGDTRAFEVLVRRYEKHVYHTAFLVTGNQEDAMDLSQEIFLRLWNGLSGFRGDAKFFTWLVTVSRNTSADWLRKKQRRPRTISMTQPEDDETPAFPEPADESPDGNPEQAAEREEQRAMVRQAVASLADDHRTVLQMRDMEGMSYEDIAAALDISVGTVKSRISRARMQVRRFLENGNFFGSSASTCDR